MNHRNNVAVMCSASSYSSHITFIWHSVCVKHLLRSGEHLLLNVNVVTVPWLSFPEVPRKLEKESKIW